MRTRLQIISPLQGLHIVFSSFPSPTGWADLLRPLGASDCVVSGGLKGRRIIAQGKALGNQIITWQALKGRQNAICILGQRRGRFIVSTIQRFNEPK